MATGIWTPVYGSTQHIVFSDPINNFEAKLQEVTVAAGDHMRFTNMTCHPVFIHTAEPTDDVDGLTGVPIAEDSNIVLPRVSPIWIYSPYDNAIIHLDVGTLT